MMRLPAIPLVLALIVAGCTTRTADPVILVGRWEGIAELPDAPARAIVDFSRDADGSLKAVISVPGERLLDKPLSGVRYDPPRVHFELQTAERTISFDGSLAAGASLARDSAAGGSLAGTIASGELTAPLTLLRTGVIPSPPYSQQEVRFKNGEVTLAGSLLLPPGEGRHPAVVLIHGSSTPSRDDFRFYGDLYARRGVAALVYDKRDVGGDLGGASRVALGDLAGDALAAVALLKQRDDIDPGRIGLWGHSQGGWVAPIAAARSADVAFVISFSGPGVSYSELTKYADATRLRAHGASQADVDDAIRALSRVDDYVRRGGDPAVLQSLLDEAWRHEWARQTTLPRRVPSPGEIETWLRWRDLDLDPVDYWEKITVPVLVLFGELDDVVPVQASASRIEAALKRAGNRDVTIRIFPRAGHTIQPAPEFLDLMVDWTVRRTK